MRGIARLNDVTKGTCYHPSHPPRPASGKIITGSDTVFVDGRPVARFDDIVKTDCGHYDYIIGYKDSVFGDTQGFARLNDQVGKNGIYIATIVSASSTTSTI